MKRWLLATALLPLAFATPSAKADLMFVDQTDLSALGDSLAVPVVVAAPGPAVGTGIPGIIAGCLGLVGLARRRIARMRVY